MNNLKNENIDWYRWIEKRVCAKGTLYGTLKYFGTTKFCDGFWCGIELDKPVGKNNGTVNNVTYFSCLPKFGIFVPMSKVSKIGNDPQNSTFTLNGTFQRQNSPVNTTLVAELKSNGKSVIRQDSEESLGLLDPNLIDSLTNSWDAIDVAVSDIIPDSPDNILKVHNQGVGFTDHYLPTSNHVFSDEISNPKYASTPRHPTKKRFTNVGDIDEMGLALQTVNEHNDVNENQIDGAQDVFFDTDKFRQNPNLRSTCKLYDANVNSLSPIQCDHASNSIDLNKTQIFPSPFITDQGISPILSDLNKTQTVQLNLNKTQTVSSDMNKTQTVSSDLNKTQTVSPDLNKTQTVSTFVNQTLPLQNGCNESVSNDVLKANIKMPEKIESQFDHENKDKSLLQKTFALDSCLSEEKCSSKHKTPQDAISDNGAQLESFEYKSRFLEDMSVLEKSLSDVDEKDSMCRPFNSCNTSKGSQRFSNKFDKKGKVTNKISISSNSRKNMSNVQLKTNIDKKMDGFKKPLPVYSSIRKPKSSLNCATGDTEKNKSLQLKERVLMMHSKSKERVKDCVDSVFDIKTKQVKENVQLSSIKSKSAIPSKSLVSDPTDVCLIDKKLKKGRLSLSAFDMSNEFNKFGKVTELKYSHRISYSQGSYTSRLSSTSDCLPLRSKCNENSTETNLAASKALPTNGLKEHIISKVPLNKKDTGYLKTTMKTYIAAAKIPSTLQLNKQVIENNLLVSQNLELSSIGRGIPRRNTLASSSKTNLPVGVIKPRYSMLPSVKERSPLVIKNTEINVNQLTQSSNCIVLEAESNVNGCVTASSSKTSRIASSLPRKTNIATRKMGQQKFSDVKEENDACEKIPRYNLRRKK